MVTEYQIKKEFIGHCTYYIQAESKTEAINKAREMHIMNATVDELTSLHIEEEYSEEN